MATAWYAILSFTLGVFVVLDGWNLGAGALGFVIAKSDSERRQLVAALGPLWSWHEVWLLATGGVLFLAFPEVLATAFSGFYLALFLLLWALVLRGVSLEFAGHVDDPMWRIFFDVVFAAASALLAILLGAAFGNVVRGVPLDREGRFLLPLFTDFTARGAVGILDWYTLGIALFAALTLCAHGASYVRLRSTGPLAERAGRTSRVLWAVALVLLPVISVATSIVRPEFFPHLAARPLAWLFGLAVLGGAVALVVGERARKDWMAFVGSVSILSGLLGGAAVAFFPVLLRSTLDSSRSLTAAGALAPGIGPAVALVWCPIAIGLGLTYAWFVARSYRGRVSPGRGPDPDPGTHNPYD